MCKSNDHDLSKCADYKDWQLQKQLEEESRLLSLIPSLEDSLQDPRPPQQVLTRRQQEIFEKGQSKSNGSYADIVSSRIAQRHKKRKKKERPKTSESPEEKKSDSPPDTKTHYTGPIGEVINRLDLSAMKHGLLVPFLKDAVPHLQLSYDQWVTEMSVLLQQKLNEAIQEEEKKVSRELSEQHATRLDSGQWTIHCECGMHFHMSKAEEHLQVCTLDPQPSPPTPSLPSTTPRKKRSRSTPTKEIQPDSAIIEIDEHSEDVEPLRTPSKKASLRRDEGTPESVKQMKITSMMQSSRQPPPEKVESQLQRPATSSINPKNDVPPTEDTSSRPTHRSESRRRRSSNSISPKNDATPTNDSSSARKTGLNDSAGRRQ